MYNLPNLEKAVKALEYMRKVLFEDWMTQSHFDFVVSPQLVMSDLLIPMST